MQVGSLGGNRKIALGLIFCAALILGGCGEDLPNRMRTTPTASGIGPPSDSTLTPTPDAPETEYRLVYQEVGAKEDVIWRVGPADLAQREKLATIPHREGWPVEATLSPDGRLLAYLSQPDAAMSAASSQAEAYVLDLKTQQATLIVKDVDFQLRPFWAPDGRRLFLRRYAGFEFLSADISLLQIEIPPPPPFPTPTPGRRTPTPTPSPDPSSPTPVPEDPVKTIIRTKVSTALALIPVGFADDGKAMLFVLIQGGTGGGTVVCSYSPATTEAIAMATAEATAAASASASAGVTPTPTPTPLPPGQTPTPVPLVPCIMRLSEQIARDYDLSLDRKRLSFLQQELTDGQFRTRAYIAELKAKTASPVPMEGLHPTDHFRPLWHPDGRLAIGLAPANGEPGEVAVIGTAPGTPLLLPAAESGFDVPVAWAPDGTFLAATHFSGESAVNPGITRLDLVAPTGQRVIVAEGVEVRVLGWTINGASGPS